MRLFSESFFMQYNVTFWVVNSTIGPPLVAFAVMADYALYYSGQFVLSKDKYDPTGKAAWIAELLAKNPVPGVRLCSPKPTSLNNASCVHSENYLLAMQTGQPVETANSSKITWDPGLADGLERL
jgi:hypothetical protein